MPVLPAQNATFGIISSHMGGLSPGVNATSSFNLTSSVFYDAILIGFISNTTTDTSTMFKPSLALHRSLEPGKAIGGKGRDAQFLSSIGLTVSPVTGIFIDNAADVTMELLDALSRPSRFPHRFRLDDSSICG